MSATLFDTHGSFIQVPDYLLDLKLSPACRLIYSVLLSFYKNKGEAYICRSIIKAKTRLAETTISTCVTILEKAGLLKRTGKYKHGTYPKVMILARPNRGVSKCKLHSSQIKTPQLANANPQKKQENLIKEKQTPEIVCPNFNFELCDQLKTFGISSNQSNKLVKRYPKERIEKQIGHLKFLQERGDKIENPAGWLTGAIQKKFKLPKTYEEQQIQKKEQANQEKIRKSQKLNQDARHKLNQHKLDSALSLAKKSIEVHENSEAKRIIHEIKKQQAKESQQEQALKKIPKEEFKKILEKERQKQMGIFAKLGFKKLGAFGEKAAYQGAVQIVAEKNSR